MIVKVIKIKNNELILFETEVGSTIWKMNNEKSDLDIASCYLMNSKEMLIGKKKKGKQIQKGIIDKTLYELGMVIPQLIKGNVNYIWMITSPIVIFEKYNALKELRQIVIENLSKKTYHSINGLATHNIHHFIDGGDRESYKYRKKLNVIGRTLKFGINLLTWKKIMYEKVDIKDDNELIELKYKLDEALANSILPEEPNEKPFHDYLIKYRLKKIKMDGYNRDIL